MLTFLINNAGTIVTALVLAAAVFFVVRGMVRDRKAPVSKNTRNG